MPNPSVPGCRRHAVPASSGLYPTLPRIRPLARAVPWLSRTGSHALAAIVTLALSAPEAASANNYAESVGWQFRTSADQVNQAAILDILQKRRGGFYAAPSYTTNIARQVNCSISATATGNSGSQTALANSPTVTGATSRAAGNDSVASNGEGRSGGRIGNEQHNSGTISSGVTGGTTTSVRGTADQALNSSQTNSGTQSASVQGSNACTFGALN